MSDLQSQLASTSGYPHDYNPQSPGIKLNLCAPKTNRRKKILVGLLILLLLIIVSLGFWLWEYSRFNSLYKITDKSNPSYSPIFTTTQTLFWKTVKKDAIQVKYPKEYTFSFVDFGSKGKILTFTSADGVRVQISRSYSVDCMNAFSNIRKQNEITKKTLNVAEPALFEEGRIQMKDYSTNYIITNRSIIGNVVFGQDAFYLKDSRSRPQVTSMKQIFLCIYNNAEYVFASLQEFDTGKRLTGLKEFILMMHTVHIDSSLTPLSSSSTQTLNDTAKDDILSKIAFYIDKFYQEAETLPVTLSQLPLGPINRLYKGAREFVNSKVKYIPSSNDPSSNYLLCASFDSTIEKLTTAYFVRKTKDGDGPSGFQCFELKVFASSSSSTVMPTTKYEGPTVIQDTHIESVKTDAKYTLGEYTTAYTLVDGRSNQSINNEPGFIEEFGYHHFPYGFFSEDVKEWGLIAKAFDINSNAPIPITVQITFKQPVKLLRVSSLFSNCQIIDCYKWQVSGVTQENEQFLLGDDIQTGKDAKSYSTQEIVSDKEFKEIKIFVTRVDNTYDDILVWKKIKIDYIELAL